jgi:hypothetical protein
VALAFIAFGGAFAQDAPPTDGPYLWVQGEQDHVVLVATGTRHRTEIGWAATSITVFDLDGVGQVRVHAVIEADCARQIRRSETLHLFPAPEIDSPEPRTSMIPGVPWSGLGPDDGAIMAFLCEGQTDAGRTRVKVSQHVSAWRAGG